MTTYTPKVYLPDATDFTDIEKREPAHDHTVECPKCHGYGRWNLELNAYGGPAPGDPTGLLPLSPDQRHFRASCGQCWGWGYVRPGLDVTCLHTMVAIAPDQPWRCWHTTRCTKCGTTQSYSSDD